MSNDLAVAPGLDLGLDDDDFAQFDVEELSAFDVTAATAMPALGASKARFTCCSSSSSSSCCSA